MSLVDYSSDEDDADDDKETETDREPQRADIERKGTARFLPSSSPSPSSPSISLESIQANMEINHSQEATFKLPDASELLASFGSTKDSMMLDSSGNACIPRKKRHDNGLVSAPHRKIPKSSVLPTIKVSPDIGGGSLLPPQLRGRSNIATEDLDKLFTRKQKTDL